MSNKGTELNKFELFRLIKKLEKEKTSQSLKEEKWKSWHMGRAY